MKITKVYTKTGDKGTTSLVGGIRVKKTCARIEAYGTVDELSSNLGLLSSLMKDGYDKRVIEKVQNTLFVISSNLATDQDKTELYDSCRVDKGVVEELEYEIDRAIEFTPTVREFVLPGGGRRASMAHVCRTVCRRAERRIHALAEESTVDDDITRYINRLSDYLFVLAKKLNYLDGIKEKTWKKS